MDEDLDSLTQAELKSEVLRLRMGIRQQRDQKGHDLCWYLPELWELLPEQAQLNPNVPEWCEFMQRCAAFRKSLD